jgi:predicted phosphoribosyltransferase
MELARKRILFDDEECLHRVCWVVESECAICGDEIETIFEERPSEVEVLEASFMPCEECLDRIEAEERKERKRKKQKGKGRKKAYASKKNIIRVDFGKKR